MRARQRLRRGIIAHGFLARSKVLWFLVAPFSVLFGIASGTYIGTTYYGTSYYGQHSFYYTSTQQSFPSTDSWSFSSSYLVQEYPDCVGDVFVTRNGVCDLINNDQSCGYDGGDCCSCTCENSNSRCVWTGVDCIDPDLLNTTCWGPSTSSSTGYWDNDESTIESNVYTNCTGYVPHIGDGRCDGGNNNPGCGYDGGDCCPCTCSSTLIYSCGEGGFDCIDPGAFNATGCDLTDADSVGNSDVDPSSSSAEGNSTYSSCHISYYNDGFCDPINNNALCGYDGGDCCICTCVSTSFFVCGTSGYNCQDPDAGSLDDLCEPPVPDILPCAPDRPTRWTVVDAGGVSSFARAINCSGGTFELTWNGSIRVDETIHVVNGTTLHVKGTGSGDVADGGGVRRIFAVRNASLHVADLAFVNCSALIGGAVTSTHSSLSFERTQFLDNRARYGGALFAREWHNASWNDEVVFARNYADFAGGALFMTEGSDVSRSGRASFSHNSAENSGGAMHIRNASNLSQRGEAVFANNHAGFGGAISLWDTTARFGGNTTFWGSEAVAGAGGAIFIGSGCTVNVAGITNFTGNRATAYGGALGSLETSSGTVTSELSIHNIATFERNRCGQDGGAIALFEAISLSMGTAQLEFSLNSANASGGAVYLSGVTVGPEFVDALFLGNSAMENGGGVYTAASGVTKVGKYFSSPTSFTRCKFEGNSALDQGGAIYTASGADTIESSEFTRNKAGTGGALRLAGQRISIVNSSFLENSSDEEQGPAISNAGIQLRLVTCTFRGNFFQCPAGKFVDTNEVRP